VIKTREDVEAMIDLVEHAKLCLQSFGLWILNSLSTPVPGVIYVDTSADSDVDSV
tara:strand:- start:326 stop:490 length:165 start_codon:yes stop_codon:yes gene_type:complete